MMMMMWGAKQRWGNDTSDHQIQKMRNKEQNLIIDKQARKAQRRPEGLPPKSWG